MEKSVLKKGRKIFFSKFVFKGENAFNFPICMNISCTSGYRNKFLENHELVKKLKLLAITMEVLLVNFHYMVFHHDLLSKWSVRSI